MSSKKATKNSISLIRSEIEKVTQTNNTAPAEPLSKEQLACLTLITTSSIEPEEKIKQLQYLYTRQVRLTRDISSLQVIDTKKTQNLVELNEKLTTRMSQMQSLINKYDEVCKGLKEELSSQQEKFDARLKEEAESKQKLFSDFQSEYDKINKKIEDFNKYNKTVNTENEKLKNDIKKRDKIFKEKDKLFDEYKEAIEKRIAEMNNTVTQYYTENTVLKQQVQSLEAAKKLCDDYSKMVKTQEQAISQYKENNEKMSNLVKTMETVLETRNKTIKEKNQTINQLNLCQKQKKDQITSLENKIQTLQNICSGLQDKLRSSSKNDDQMTNIELSSADKDAIYSSLPTDKILKQSDGVSEEIVEIIDTKESDDENMESFINIKDTSTNTITTSHEHNDNDYNDDIDDDNNNNNNHNENTLHIESVYSYVDENLQDTTHPQLVIPTTQEMTNSTDSSLYETAEEFSTTNESK